MEPQHETDWIPTRITEYMTNSISIPSSTFEFGYKGGGRYLSCSPRPEERPDVSTDWQSVAGDW